MLHLSLNIFVLYKNVNRNESIKITFFICYFYTHSEVDLTTSHDIIEEGILLHHLKGKHDTTCEQQCTV